VTGRRARSDDDKAARRREILDAARQRFDAVDIDEFTMDDVAAALGLAKGTLYRYVPTREGLLLALAADEYANWFDALDAFLGGLDSERVPNSSTDDAFVGHVVTSLIERPRFLRLVTVLPSVLERNIPLDVAHDFKADVLRRSTTAATGMVAGLGLHPDRAVQLLVHLQAGVIGLSHHAHPAPVIREALTDPALAALRIDLTAELDHLVRALLVAARRPVPT
jgi:AcrR family transcriptional regulator